MTQFLENDFKKFIESLILKELLIYMMMNYIINLLDTIIKVLC